MLYGDIMWMYLLCFFCAFWSHLFAPGTVLYTKSTFSLLSHYEVYNCGPYYMYFEVCIFLLVEVDWCGFAGVRLLLFVLRIALFTVPFRFIQFRFVFFSFRFGSVLVLLFRSGPVRSGPVRSGPLCVPMKVDTQFYNLRDSSHFLLSAVVLLGVLVLALASGVALPDGRG